MDRPIVVVLPAAGVGSRMQADKPKQYLALLGKTLLEHTLDIMLTHTAISKIILVVSKDDPYIANLSLSPKIQLVEGGETRAESVLNGLNAICDKNAWVLVHDAARPCLQHTDIDKLLTIDDEQGAILAIPVTDTIKRSDNQQRIVMTEDRSQLWQAQTPQFFQVECLKRALSTALQQGVQITDEASAMEYAGFRPHLVAGRSDNLKVTRPEDLALAEFYLTRNKL